MRGLDTYTVQLAVDLRPRPWWAIRWRPWSATILLGIGYLGDTSGPARWRGKTRQDLEVRTTHWIRQHALRHGNPDPTIRIDTTKLPLPPQETGR